jgi:Lipoprotein LpqB beta-propeller domain
VRVAMITSSPNGGGATLRIGAIVRAGGQVSVGQAGPLESIGADISNPDTLTWYDAENLLVLEKSSTLGPELQEVPVNGGSSTSLTTDIDTVSISAAGPVNKIVAGLSRGQIATTSVVNGTWTTTTGAGSSPTYPG